LRHPTKQSGNWYCQLLGERELENCIEFLWKKPQLALELLLVWCAMKLEF